MRLSTPWSRSEVDLDVDLGSGAERARDQGVRFGGRFRGWALIGAVVWTVFLVPVAQDAIAFGGVRGALSLVALAVFVGAYLGTLVWRQGRRVAARGSTTTHPGTVPAYATLCVLAVLVTALVHPGGIACVVYVAVAGIFLFPQWVALGQAGVLAVASEAVARLVPGWSDAQGIGLSVFLASFAVWGIAQAIGRSMDLVAAQEENSHLMVGQERTRMARDLHDILGHSLTVITVKAELAGRMLDVGDAAGIARARAELADLERLSRDALADVRRTVEGYRDLTLPGEIARARVALEAAEIDATLPGTAEEVPTQWRELFAWTVREGVTNVVRHSGARHCTVSIAVDHVTVADDGRGCPGQASEVGNGLVGLRERAAAEGARLVTQSGAEGGFLLTVHAPGSVVVA
ncbi:histidine kinase [Dermatophilaceae bacterium Soc4.6]